MQHPPHPLTNAVLDLTCELIACPSITPQDQGCQQILSDRLAAIGFTCVSHDAADVSNLWASRGEGHPHLLFAGHTDVVPTGPEQQWDTKPFEPTQVDGELFGRGAADMKASLAAMVVALEHLDAHRAGDHRAGDHQLGAGTISLLITSDEEGDAIHGTRHVIDVLTGANIKPDFCVVGEPSSSQRLGDVVRCGRRGSINARMVVRGVQGHVAYPQDADNPVHKALNALLEMTLTKWDDGNAYYPPTSLQISNIHAGTGATNVIPGDLEVMFNLRYNTEQTASRIQDAIERICERHELDYSIDWRLSGEPFLTQEGALTLAVQQAIKHVTGIETELSTNGGTSDGRFISPWNSPGTNQVEVVEIGPVNATIHKINERVRIDDLGPLADIYAQITTQILAP